MTTNQPDSTLAKAAGRGADLFFDESDAPDATSAVAGDAAEAAAEGVDAAKDVVDDAGEAAGEGIDAVKDVAGDAAEAVDAASEPAATQPAIPRAVMTPPPAPPPAAPPEQPVLIQESSSKGSNGCLQAVLGAVFGAMLGVALTLGFLLLTNQGLSYAPRDTVNSLQATVTAYERGANALRGDLSALQGGLSASQGDVGTLQQGLTEVESQLATQGEGQSALASEVTGVAGQVQTLQDEVLPVLQDDMLGLQESVDIVGGAVQVVASDVVTLTGRVDTVSASAERAQRFLAGMQALLASVLSDEPLEATAPLTATVAPTATRLLTPTAPLTSTAPITATVPVTPEVQIPLTPTLEITATVVPTATVAPLTTPTPSANAIRGVVFLDANRDGVRDTDNEPGIANVRVTLYTQNRTEVARTTTNLRGEYEFADLAPGIYIVVQTDPPGFVSSTPNVLTVILRGNRPVQNVSFGDYQQ
jgi:hypothetical protein